MCEIDCCGMYKDGMCLENNVPCKDIEWRHCILKAVEYAENKEFEVKNLKVYIIMNICKLITKIYWKM